MDGRRKTTITKDDRKATISSTMRATKEISELPKNGEWKTEGEYVKRIVDEVLGVCERVGLLPTVNHLASALGVSREVVDDVRLGYIRSNPDVVSAVTGYYQVCENTMVQSSLDGTSNYASGIFILKSQYGYKEEPREVVVTHNKLLGERKDPAAIAQRYADAMVVDGAVKEIEDSSSVTDTECEF